MHSSFKRHVLPAVISLGLAEPALAAQYGVQLLATASSSTSESSTPYSHGLNENGKAAGTRSFSVASTGGESAVLYDHGLVTDLVPLIPNVGFSLMNHHIAHAINDGDQVVGQYSVPVPNSTSYTTRAFLIAGNGLTDLGDLGGTYSYAYDINGLGQAVGSAEMAGGTSHAVLFDVDANGTRRVVDLEAGSSSHGTAYGINTQGQIVGGTYFGGNCHKAFLYAGGAMTNLGNLGTGCNSSADAINDSGQVVGWSNTSGFFTDHGFLYSNGNMADLGTLGGSSSHALDINSQGQVVGWAFTLNDAAQHAFLYVDGQMLDINNLLPTNSGWVLNSATGINDKGQIVGEGKFNGKQAIFLLAPTIPIANAGTDVTVRETDLVTLDGSGSSAPGCATVTGIPCPVYVWKQVGGTPAMLSQTNVVAPSFTAPVLPIGKTSDVLTFELQVKDNMFTSSPATVNVTVQHINLLPVAAAGANQTVNEGGPVTLDGSASHDPDGVSSNGNYLAYSWSNPASSGVCSSIVLSSNIAAKPTFTAPLVGAAVTCSFDLMVTDADSGVSLPSTTTVTIENVNHPPVADAGANQTVNEGDTPVTLSASGSSDPDSDPLSYSWTQLGGTPVTLNNAASAAPSFTAPQVGSANDTLVFEVTVADVLGLSSTAQVNVIVLDKSAPPACDKGVAKVEADDFWPPNHKMKKVEIEGLGEDRERVASGTKQSDKDRDDVFVKILGVTQDEPTKGMEGSDASPDAVAMADEGHDRLLLRAERAGTGNGRVYQIRYGARDKAGQYCEGTVKVCVPPSKGKKAVCIDDGQQYDSYLK